MPAAPSPVATGEPIVREEPGGRSLDFDNGVVQSRMHDADPTALVLEYSRLMMGVLLLHPAPGRIALIGLGGGSLAKYWARRLPEADMTAVEISPAVIALRDRFAIPRDGPRFRVCCADGAAFVRDAAPGAYDVLLVDAFDRQGQPAPLCTAAFYDACRAALAPGGVLAVNLHTDEPDCDACVARIGDTFGGRAVAVRADGCDNLVVFAGVDRPFPPPFDVLVERLRLLEAEHPVDLGTTLRKLVQGSVPRRRRAPRRRPR